MKKEFTYNVLIITLICYCISGCSTEKNTFSTRAFHNTNARYNAFFNGNESYKNGVKKTDKALIDDYTRVLPVYAYSNAIAAKASYTDMDKTIKKASKVIKLHSIKAKPKHKSGKSLTPKDKEFYSKTEYCKWVDKSYMHMGKANVYNHNFSTANESFEYVLKEFSKEPIKYEALVWLARSYDESGKYGESKEILESLEGEKKLPKKVKADYYTTYADFYIKQEQYDDAIQRLKVAIDYTKKRRIKARYKFILAQLYQKLNQYSNALELYAEVIKINPQYEMTFNAQINRATAYNMGAGSSKEIVKQLNKMLKDDKNIDYQDQIYYALANIMYKENNLDEAIKDYKLSISKSISNSSQKALSYLALGDIFFNKPEYKPAQMYYDSAVTILPTNFPDYDKIYKKSKILNELIFYLTTVELQDSLQRLAKMSVNDRNRIVDGIIKKIQDEEDRIKREQQQQQYNAMMFTSNQQNMKNNNTLSGGKWYFYNPSALSFGQSEFKKKWGMRKNEDDWRRRNKNVINAPIAEEGDSTTIDSKTKPKVSELKTREYYLKNIPTSDSAIFKSNKKIEDALYKIGFIYKDKLNDYPLSINAFEDLIKRFPKSDYILPLYYNLLTLNQLIKNSVRENYYKNLIITQFPESNYAKMLTDPNFYKQLESKNNSLNEFYSSTYNEFQNRNYRKVINNYKVADSVYKNNNLMPKFMLLKAMSFGGIGDIESYKNCLKDIIAKYPKNEEKNSANDLLAYLDKRKSSPNQINNNANIVNNSNFKQTQLNTKNNKDTVNARNNISKPIEVKKAEEIYKINDAEVHYYVILVDNSKVNVNHLKYNIVNFNSDNYSLTNFSVKAIVLRDNLQFITVEEFSNKKDAIQYFNQISRDKEVFKDISNYQHFIISGDNYRTFYFDKDINKYLKFFNTNYPLNE